MLEINMEFRKGILFIRLIGEITEKTASKLESEVTELVEETGIHNLVFNLEGVTNIDIKGINALLENYNICKKNDGKTLVCNLDNSLVKHRIYNSRLLKYMYEASDEISAINVLSLEGGI